MFGRTASCLNLENALLGASVLEGIQERGLNREKSPVSISRRVGSWGRAVDNAIVAALYGNAVRREIKRRHRRGV